MRNETILAARPHPYRMGLPVARGGMAVALIYLCAFLLGEIGVPAQRRMCQQACIGKGLPTYGDFQSLRYRPLASVRAVASGPWTNNR